VNLLLLLALAALPDGLLFHASFEKDGKAAVAKGNAQLFSAATYKNNPAGQPGLAAAPNAALVPGAGRNGSGALRFNAKNENAVYFEAAKNVNFAAGTISFWLRLDPNKDLAPGYCDPFQLTDKDYNNSAIWVDFTKDERPRHFRLGVFGALKAWNPTDIPPDKNPAFNNRLVVHKNPPFTAAQWTHVAITHQGLGTPNGTASLYLNGTLIGTANKIPEAFDWAAEKTKLRLGVNYVGLFDDLMIFNRPLNAAEIKSLGAN
jgi:hypothetical protein